MEEQLTLKQVANIMQVETTTVRFWEKEFSEFLEQPDYKGQRKRFSQNNLETLAQIKGLLQTEQYTIKGAKRRIEIDRSLAFSMGFDPNFKTTTLFMFSSIMEELKASRNEIMELRCMVESLKIEKSLMEEKIAETQNKGLFEYLKDKIQNKKTESSL